MHRAITCFNGGGFRAFGFEKECRMGGTTTGMMIPAAAVLMKLGI